MQLLLFGLGTNRFYNETLHALSTNRNVIETYVITIRVYVYYDDLGNFIRFSNITVGPLRFVSIRIDNGQYAQ